MLMLDNDQKEVDTSDLSTRTTANRCSEERSHRDEEREQEEEEDGKRGERACGWHLGCGLQKGGCLHTSPPIVHFVISRLTAELVCDWPHAPATRPPVPPSWTPFSSTPHPPITPACSPAMLRTTVGPPPIQAAINRGQRSRGAVSVMRLDPTSLHSQCFIELQLSFNSASQCVEGRY